MVIYLKAEKEFSLWSLGMGAISLSCVPTVPQPTAHLLHGQALSTSVARTAALQAVQNPSARHYAKAPLAPNTPGLSACSHWDTQVYGVGNINSCFGWEVAMM